MTATIAAPNRHPANSEIDVDSGARWYIHPITGERFLSVTSILKVIAKEALVHWAAKVVAEEAMDQLPTLVRRARVRPCEQTGDDRCGLCRACAVTDLRGRPAAVRDAAADVGSRVHTAAERYALTGELDGNDEEIAPFLAQYLAWQRQFQPAYDAAEMTVISREYGYAGTLDGIVRLGWCPPKHADLVGQPLVLDLKSGKGVYDEFALQLAAYRNADTILLPDGTELPMPATSETALVLHLRPDAYQVHPVPVTASTHGAFLSAFALYRWQADETNAAIGRAMYKPPITARTPKPKTTPAVRPPKRPTAPAFPPASITAGNTLTDSSIPF